MKEIHTKVGVQKGQFMAIRMSIWRKDLTEGNPETTQWKRTGWARKDNDDPTPRQESRNRAQPPGTGPLREPVPEGGDDKDGTDPPVSGPSTAGKNIADTGKATLQEAIEQCAASIAAAASQGKSGRRRTDTAKLIGWGEDQEAQAAPPVTHGARQWHGQPYRNPPKEQLQLHTGRSHHGLPPKQGQVGFPWCRSKCREIGL